MATVVKPRGCTNLKLRQLNRVVTRHYDPYATAVGFKNTQYSLFVPRRGAGSDPALQPGATHAHGRVGADAQVRADNARISLAMTEKPRP